MFVLVTGGSGSGKSEYAEGRVLEFGNEKRYYIATMMCFDQESQKRVARHRKMRAGKGFETVERYLDLKTLDLMEVRDEASVEEAENVEHQRCTMDKKKSTTILLECMSNLAANEVFDPMGAGKLAAEEIKTGIDRLIGKCDNLVVVTNEIFSDGIEYDEETRVYMKILGEINCYMAEIADEVVEVVYGIPVYHKTRGNRSRKNTL